ncbi:hypothetical protein SDC9_194753 [bioreactor metagenome]|uniref:Uncharacterized protein n=1 Tax=bioreactor metagenome TaxID=1076179 RepID=A0A645IIH9_9ZZZZ
MADDRVGNFVEPVYAVEHQRGGDGLVVLLVNFIHVDDHDECKNRDERPVEVAGVAHGRLGEIGKRLEARISKEHGTYLPNIILFGIAKQ